LHRRPREKEKDPLYLAEHNATPAAIILSKTFGPFKHLDCPSTSSLSHDSLPQLHALYGLAWNAPP
jgi:hypothetical protein